MWIMGGDSIGGAVALLLGTHHWLSLQLEHVAWEGCRFYDLIFPTFVFLAGVSAVFSLGRIRDERGKDAAFVRLLQRAILLYLMGLFYYGLSKNGEWHIRLLGVLQRIALAYLGAGFLFIFYKPRTLIVVAATILIGYWAALKFIPVPGFGVGDLAEGHNLVNWFDSKYLPGFKWDGDHDPEGILSTFPAIVTCLLGVFAGRVLRDDQRLPVAKTLWLIGYGAALLTAGFATSFALGNCFVSRNFSELKCFCINAILKSKLCIGTENTISPVLLSIVLIDATLFASISSAAVVLKKRTCVLLLTSLETDNENAEEINIIPITIRFKVNDLVTTRRMDCEEHACHIPKQTKH